MSLLREIYYGNIMFTETGIMENREYRKRNDKLNKLEEEFKTSLNAGQQEMLIEYNNAFTSVNSISEAEGFLFGFKTGALLMIELLTGADIDIP